MPFTIKRGDTRPVIDIPLVERANPEALLTVVDLTSVDVALVLLRGKGTDTEVARAGTVVAADPDLLGLDPADFESGELGATIDIVRLTFANGDTDVADKYRLEVELTYDDGGVETVPNDDYEELVVKDDLGP